MTNQPTCEDRIAEHLSGRDDDFRALCELSQTYDAADFHELSEHARELLSESGDEYGVADAEDGRIQEYGMERASEYPLGVSAYTTFKVELSWGGPADWLEVVCAGDTPTYEGIDADSSREPYSIERIVYHFADWFDHAERELDGDELANAEAFVRYVVPELVE